MYRSESQTQTPADLVQLQTAIRQLVWCQNCDQGGIGEDANFCQACAVPIVRDFKRFGCPSCGRQYDISGNHKAFCMKCGTALRLVGIET